MIYTEKRKYFILENEFSCTIHILWYNTVHTNIINKMTGFYEFFWAILLRLAVILHFYAYGVHEWGPDKDFGLHRVGYPDCDTEEYRKDLDRGAAFPGQTRGERISEAK